MSEATEALASAWLVIGTTDYEPHTLIQVYLDEKRANGWCAELQAYHATHPGWWSDDATDAERDEAYDRLEAWRKAHPAGEIAAGCMGFDVLQLPLADAPALLGYANARALGHFQDGRATSIDVVRDKATLWRSRGRDGDPVAVFVQGEDDSDLVSQAREALASGETPVPADPATLRTAVDRSV